MENEKDDKYEYHPAYGTIQISRFQGGHYTLFGSKLKHNSGVALRISQAGVKREYHEEQIYPEHRPLIEVYMSEAQFAHFVASMNLGAGTPCTIQYVQGKRTPRVPESSMREKFQQELKEDCAKIGKDLSKLVDDLQKLRENKTIKKADIDQAISTASRVYTDIVSNLPFLNDMFTEAMEKTVADGRIEIDAYLTNALKITGLMAAQKEPLPEPPMLLPED